MAREPESRTQSSKALKKPVLMVPGSARSLSSGRPAGPVGAARNDGAFCYIKPRHYPAGRPSKPDTQAGVTPTFPPPPAGGGHRSRFLYQPALKPTYPAAAPPLSLPRLRGRVGRGHRPGLERRQSRSDQMETLRHPRGNRRRRRPCKARARMGAGAQAEGTDRSRGRRGGHKGAGGRAGRGRQRPAAQGARASVWTGLSAYGVSARLAAAKLSRWAGCRE